MATLRLEIVTPESKTFSDNVDSVVLPGVEGELGIFPMHVPLMTLLAPGELRVMKGGQEERLAVGEGFVEITQSSVSVLTDMAILESEIDVTATEAAIERAKAAMEDSKLSGEDHATIEAALQKSLAKLRVKHRKRH